MSTRNLKPGPDRVVAILCTAVFTAMMVASCGGKEPRPKSREGGSPAAGAPAGQDRRPAAGAPVGQDRRPAAGVPVGEDRRSAPDFSLKDLDGRDVRLTDFRGKVVMVNFWATWCPPCRAEIPDFIELQSRLGPKGLQIIGISLDDEGAAKVAPFASQNRINYTMLVNGNGVANAFGVVEGIPTTYLLDRQGRVVERRVGVAPREHWQQVIASLLSEG